MENSTSYITVAKRLSYSYKFYFFLFLEMLFYSHAVLKQVILLSVSQFFLGMQAFTSFL